MAMAAGAQASSDQTESSFDEKLCKTPMLIPPALKKLLSQQKKIDVVDTLEQVLDATKEYIYKNNLFNAQNPVLIDASNNELGRLLGVESFSLMEIKQILLRLLLAENRESYAKLLQLPINKEIANSKRKKGTFDEICTSPVDTMPTKYICNDTRHRLTPSISDDSSCNSDIEDGSNSSDSESDISFSGENIFAEMYDVEYEIETDQSLSSCDSSFSTDSEIESILHFTALTELAASESDEAFLADQSSNDDFSLSESSDNEISMSDKWICVACSSLNKPTIRFCMKCYEERSEWVSEKKVEKRGRESMKERKRRKKKSCPKEEKQENVSSAESTSQNEDLCIICCSNKKNSVIIHGRTGHNVSCYKCAKRLYINNKSCPIDRRPIDKVIYLL